MTPTLDLFAWADAGGRACAGCAHLGSKSLDSGLRHCWRLSTWVWPDAPVCDEWLTVAEPSVWANRYPPPEMTPAMQPKYASLRSAR